MAEEGFVPFFAFQEVWVLQKCRGCGCLADYVFLRHGFCVECWGNRGPKRKYSERYGI